VLSNIYFFIFSLFSSEALSRIDKAATVIVAIMTVMTLLSGINL
jgi:hypothetical protein